MRSSSSILVFARRQAHKCVVSQLYPSHSSQHGDSRKGHDLAARSLSLSAETPAVTVTQVIFTPWPIVLGLVNFSAILLTRELKIMRRGSVT
jgi:hypothetical protein